MGGRGGAAADEGRRVSQVSASFKPNLLYTLFNWITPQRLKQS